MLFKKRNIVKSKTSSSTLKPDLKKIKISNSIVIGGMIAFGKSTLAKKINEKIEKSNIVFELNDEDQLMTLLLEKMYERSNNVLYGSVFQLYFVLNRFDNYKKCCNQNELTIFDRSIFEDWLFAHENIVRPSVFSYYDSLWKDVATELIYQYGVPKLYVILTGNWELFKKRLFERNRKIEIDNFKKNETYFKKLLEIYDDYMINVCKDFGIDYILVDANKELDEKIDIVLNKLKEIEETQSYSDKSNEIEKINKFVKSNNIEVNTNEISTLLMENLNDIFEKEDELNVFRMRLGLGKYKTSKSYLEISHETNLSINKIKTLEKNTIKKIKDAINIIG